MYIEIRHIGVGVSVGKLAVVFDMFEAGPEE
jgi:hypothetical protein